ncbi:hypothetical protein MUB46_22345 [Microbaculum sp. A6E488]|uniref:Sulfotransferase family protein n=1 Tax=Microbaculum marinisediminis TaxID=2931392 RepID=A0AAW5R8A8_9HYPH|nr:hypothetical protein [Microbaculum sp. A6E488]
MDELNNHPRVICHSEIVRPRPLDAVAAAFEKFGKDYPEKANTIDRVLPYKLFAEEDDDTAISPDSFGAYWQYIESKAIPAPQALGFKVLEAHVKNTAFPDLCRESDVAIIHLVRRNVFRKVISWMVAKQVGVYNSRGNYEPEAGRRLTPDPADVVKRVRRMKTGNDSSEAEVASSGARSITVYYEDWLADRDAFFARVCGFLGVDAVTPDQTTLIRMVPEPMEELLGNYPAVADAMRAAGFGEYLD